MCRAVRQILNGAARRLSEVQIRSWITFCPSPGWIVVNLWTTVAIVKLRCVNRDDRPLTADRIASAVVVSPLVRAANPNPEIGRDGKRAGVSVLELLPVGVIPAAVLVDLQPDLDV